MTAARGNVEATRGEHGAASGIARAARGIAGATRDSIGRTFWGSESGGGQRRHRAIERWVSCAFTLLAIFLSSPAEAAPKVVVGSKAFPESWILGEAVTALIARGGSVNVEHRRNLGGTEIAFEALRSGSIDVYPEYTGTVNEVLLKSKTPLTQGEMRARLAEQNLEMTASLGFNDGYALAMRRPKARDLRLEKLSDLRDHPELRVGLTHEFLGRADGYRGLSRRYGFAFTDVRGIQHELAYHAVEDDQLDVIDIYTTDPEVEKLDLALLRDDLAFFPRYDAVLLYRRDLASRAPAAIAALTALVGKIDEPAMIRANAEVVLHHASVEEGARTLLEGALGADAHPVAAGKPIVHRVFGNVARHLELVGISLLFAVAFGIPLGIVATRSKAVSIVALAGAGLLQTVPSLALLAFLIPLFGIGTAPALVALFVYGLLPIVQGTYTGLSQIPAHLAEAADAIGLSPRTKLRRVALPMASPAILAGVKTSAVINVGTATLAALIGADGLGNPILQGIALRDTALILEGALPAALVALLVQGAFSWLERVVVPEGLRISSRAR